MSIAVTADVYILVMPQYKRFQRVFDHLEGCTESLLITQIPFVNGDERVTAYMSEDEFHTSSRVT